MENRCHTTVEVVNGIIIDGDAPQCSMRGAIVDRHGHHSRFFFGNCDHDIKIQALLEIEKLKERIGLNEYKRLYPTGMELRIWDN